MLFIQPQNLYRSIYMHILMWFTNRSSSSIDVSKLEQRLSSVESDLINVLAQQKMLRDKVLRRFRGDITTEYGADTEKVINVNPFYQ